MGSKDLFEEAVTLYLKNPVHFSWVTWRAIPTSALREYLPEREINILPLSMMRVKLQKLRPLSTATKAEYEKVWAQPALPDLSEQKIETISQEQQTSWRTAILEPP